MGKLELIILKCGNAILDLPKTNDPIGKPLDEAVKEIKGVIESIYTEAEQSPKGTVKSEFFRLLEES